MRREAIYMSNGLGFSCVFAGCAAKADDAVLLALAGRLLHGSKARIYVENQVRCPGSSSLLLLHTHRFSASNSLSVYWPASANRHKERSHQLYRG